ncbi:TolC family protein [Rubrivirga sp. IMCC43871]|uniref:TolC family protein n=1 Tax=Rubrivirga sp. IMCC43871 TaxID=3391575 RepID=UPI00398FDF75
MRAALLFLLLAVGVSAQPAERVVPLGEALGLARVHSAAVLRAAAEAEGARASLDAVRASRRPALSAYGGGGQRYGLAFDQTTGALTQATIESIDAGLAAEVVVFDGFEARSRARSASAALLAARLGGERAAHAAAAETVRGYLAVAQARAAREVAEAEAHAQARLADEVAAQVALGARPASETAEQAERVAAAQTAVVLATRDLALARAGLVRLLGLDPAGTYAFPAPPAADPTPLPPTEALVTDALRTRPDIRAADAATAAARSDIRAAHASRLPRIALAASVGTGFTSAAANPFGGQLSDNRAGSLGLRVSVPLLDRGATRAQVRQATARASALGADAADARRAAALDVETSRVRLDALAEMLPLASARVAAAETALAAERARYDAGTTTLQAVSQLRTRLTASRTDAAVLAVTTRFERLLLALATGTVL